MPVNKLGKHQRKKDIIRRKDMADIEDEAKSIIDRILGDVSKYSATKQLLFGVASGWTTGFLAMRVGKVAAFAVGGGIILLEIANEKGYIQINWDKVNREVDRVTDKVEELSGGEGPSWIDKMERYVDGKIDAAEGVIKNKKSQATHWYSSITGASKGGLTKVQLFLVSYFAGLAVGIVTS